MARAYHGPVLVPTLAEIKRIYDAIRFSRDPEAVSLRAKCEAALAADPRFRTPTT
jgi:hypothetical protein